MESKICLIRHGITEGNKLQVFYGGVDIPLHEDGIAALKKQVEDGIYPRYESAEYYTSGMLRTEQTFEIIFGNQKHAVLPKLEEMHFGEFEMKHYRDLKMLPEFTQWFGDKSGETAAPGGESILGFKNRIAEGFEELKTDHFQQVIRLRNREAMAASVVVCHGGPIARIMDICWPGKYEDFFGWTPDPGHGYILTLDDCAVVGYDKF